MQAVCKYELQLTGRQEIELPSSLDPLCIQMQGGTPCLWALIDVDAERTKATVKMYGTGWKMDYGYRTYLGTVQICTAVGDTLEFHYFLEEE